MWRAAGDMGWELADEFAALLEDPEVRLAGSAPEEGASPPEIRETEPFLGLWQSCTWVTYTEDNAGQWLFEATARLDGGVELSAAMLTIIRPEGG